MDKRASALTLTFLSCPASPFPLTAGRDFKLSRDASHSGFSCLTIPKIWAVSFACRSNLGLGRRSKERIHIPGVRKFPNSCICECM